MPRDEDIESQDVLDEQDDDEEIEDSSSSDADDSDDDEEPSKPAPADNVKRLQSRLTRQGRRTANAERRANQAEQRAAAVEARLVAAEQMLGRITQDMSARDAAQTKAYLDSLPPEQRALAEVDLLKRQIAGTGQPRQLQPRSNGAQPPAPRRNEPDPVEYMRERSQQILDDLMDKYDVDLDDDDLEAIDWETEESFVTTAEHVAKLKAKGGPVATKKKTSSKDDAESDDEMRDRIYREERAKRSSGNPNSARAISPGRRGKPVTAERMQEVMSGYDSSKGPKYARAQLAKLSK